MLCRRCRYFIKNVQLSFVLDLRIGVAAADGKPNILFVVIVECVEGGRNWPVAREKAKYFSRSLRHSQTISSTLCSSKRFSCWCYRHFSRSSDQQVPMMPPATVHARNTEARARSTNIVLPLARKILWRICRQRILPDSLRGSPTRFQRERQSCFRTARPTSCSRCR